MKYKTHIKHVHKLYGTYFQYKRKRFRKGVNKEEEQYVIWTR
jgi:hypothetical protein